MALTIFQFASTAFTVTKNDEPIAALSGVPVFPVGEPGSAVSPGTRTWSLFIAPGFTVIDEVTPAVIPPFVRSVAVTVAGDAVLNVTANVCVPPDNVLLAGSTAYTSLEVI